MLTYVLQAVNSIDLQAGLGTDLDLNCYRKGFLKDQVKDGALSLCKDHTYPVLSSLHEILY